MDAVHRGEESKGLQEGRLVELPPNSQKTLGVENEHGPSTYYPDVTDEEIEAREFKEPVKVLGGSRSQGSQFGGWNMVWISADSCPLR